MDPTLLPTNWTQDDAVTFRGIRTAPQYGRILDTAATLVTRDDVITVDGKPIGSAQATRVWRYHKPVGLLTSHNDPAGRPTVFESLPAGTTTDCDPAWPGRWQPVGSSSDAMKPDGVVEIAADVLD